MSAGDDKAERLAAALRANLKRRKAQSRSRAEQKTESDPGTETHPAPAKIPAGDAKT